MKNRILQKRLKSLATRCLSEIDAVSDAKDLLKYYDVDLQEFMKSFLINEMGFSEPPAVLPSKRPERKTGQRPDKPKNKQKNPPSQPREEDGHIPPIKKNDSRPKDSWEKRLYKKIMMEVHPDRLDAVSKNERDRYRRIDFGERMQESPSAAEVLSIGVQLEIHVELTHNEQFSHLNQSLVSSISEIKNVQSMIGWTWGESLGDEDTRCLVVKRLLQINNINPPEDAVILKAIKAHK